MRSAPVAADRRPRQLGRDTGPAGRVVRALGGGWLVLGGIRTLIEDPRPTPLDAAAAAGTVLALTGLYAVLVRGLGDRVLARLSPWTSAALLLTPVLALYLATALVDVPRPLLAGALWYVGASLLLISVTGYGGCEVVGVPMVLLRRRYTVYCPLNTVDAAERPLQRGSSPLRLVAAALAALGAIYYFLLQDALGVADVHPPVDSRLPVILLLPATVVLAWRALHGIRDSSWAAMTAETRSHGIGALALTGTAVGLLAFGDILFVYAAFLVVIYTAGVVACLRQLRRRRG